MASHSKELWTKDGRRYFILRESRGNVSKGTGKTPLQRRWYVPEDKLEHKRDPDGVLAKLLAKAVMEFENACREGKVLSRAEQKEKARQEAEKAEAERQAALEAARQAELEASKIKTFRQYMDEVFLPEKKRKTTSGNYAYYYYLSRSNFAAIDDLKLPEISAKQIEDMLYSKIDEGASQSRTHGMYITLKQLFEMAEDDNLVENNPMRSKGLRKEPKRDKDSEYIKRLDSNGGKEKALAYTPEEVQRIEKYLDELPLEQRKWMVFTKLAIHTGMRKGEIAALKWGAIDFDQECIHVSSSLKYNSLDKKAAISAPKTISSRRDIDMKPKIKELLKNYKPDDAGDNDLLFSQESGEPISLSSINSFAKRFGKQHEDIIDFHPHKLRHTFATISISNGKDVDVAKVSKVLGHANPAITLKVYAHAFSEKLGDVTSAFEAGIAVNE